jgi:hypothetical protein
MPVVQPELDFEAARDTASPDLEARLLLLLGVLGEARTWLTRRDLEARGFGERELRELAEYDREGRVFSYPGSPGYKLFDLVTDEEFDRCGSLKSQGEKMLHRWTVYQRRWHRRGKARGDAHAGG